MGVLFAMPTWHASSELWMQRMIEALEPHLVAIASHAPEEPSWRGRIPAIGLGDTRAQRIASRLGLAPRSGWGAPGSRALRAAVEDRSVTAVLIHYLEFALRFEDVWAGTVKPLFVHCHGYDVTWDLRSHEDPNRRRYSPDYLASARRLSERASLIANSRFTAAKLSEAGIAAERVIVKYLGVPVPGAPPQRSAGAVRCNVLYLGRLVDFKGPDLVIRAFEIACDRGFEGSLTIAGDGALRPTCELLRCRSRHGDRIRLVGSADARASEGLRLEADIFTAHNCLGPLTRQQEAFGVSIVEAMACALPVVTGSSGAVTETVVHGETGLLVSPGDIEAHAEALLKLEANPVLRLEMGRAGWHRVRERFSRERERAELVRILGLEGLEGSGEVGGPRGAEAPGAAGMLPAGSTGRGPRS